MPVTMFDVIDLKSILKPYNVTLHFVDACGSQSFSLEGMINEEIKTIISDYFQKKGMSINFIRNDSMFIIL